MIKKLFEDDDETSNSALEKALTLLDLRRGALFDEFFLVSLPDDAVVFFEGFSNAGSTLLDDDLNAAVAIFTLKVRMKGERRWWRGNMSLYFEKLMV